MESEKIDVDTVVILSSDLIATIAQDYFNKVLFKRRVEVVDLQPNNGGGYAFGLAFSDNKRVPPQIPTLPQVPAQVLAQVLALKDSEAIKHPSRNDHDDDSSLNMLVLESLDSIGYGG